jgi:hypothetical protein
MSGVTRFFFRLPYASRSTWGIIRWWEARRAPYNLAVGVAGLSSVATVALVSTLPPHPPHFQVPWDAIAVYGVLANLFFCFGPALDAAICRRWGSNYTAIGPALFRYGFAFAVGLTLLPIPLALIGWGLRLLGVVQ